MSTDLAGLSARIQRLDKENEYLRRENLFFSRYLMRINSEKIVRKFADYQYEEDNEILQEILAQTQATHNARRAALKRSLGLIKKETTGWTFVVTGGGEQAFNSYLPLVERERVTIAAYETQQTRLERKRMNEKATAALYQLEVSLQSIDSDKTEQKGLNQDLHRRVDKYRSDVGEEEFNSPSMHVPGELVVGRINKRIHSRLSLIGQIRISNTRLHIRIEEILGKIRLIEDFIDKMDDVDVTLMRTRKINNSEIYAKVDDECRQEKCALYEINRRLQERRVHLAGQEVKINEMMKKVALQRGYVERTTMEIAAIDKEHEHILEENYSLKERIADVAQVPTITDYAHLMHRIKSLQQEIKIWTQRVTIAETLLSQLSREHKPPRRLSPLRSTASHVHA